MAQPVIDSDALALFTEELALCKVRAGEVVAVVTAGNQRADYAQAFMLAAQHHGADAFQINVPRPQRRAAGVQGRHPLVGNRPAIDAAKSADLLVDLMGLLFSPEQAEIQASGTRILRVVEPVHVLQQMFPTEDLRRRVEHAKELLESAKTLRFTSEAGTDVLYRFGQYPVMSEYGYTDEPGRWDHFPSGFPFTQASDGQVEGVVVLQPGDILAAFKRYIQTPVRLTIREGMVVEISGGGPDAALIRDYMDSFNDPRGYAVAHIGWGNNENARWHQFATSAHVESEYVMNALAFYGNVLFSTGPNTELGGVNDTPCHMDIPMRNCSLWLDDTQILDKGRIVLAELRVPGR